MREQTITKREAASLVLRLMGVYIAVRYLEYVPTALGALSLLMSPPPGAVRMWLLLSSVLPPVAYFAVCALLVFGSDWIARRLVPEDKPVFGTGTVMSTKEVLSLAFCCLGLAILAGAIPRIPQAAIIMSVVRWGSPGPGRNRGTIQGLAQVAGIIIQAAIGLVLFLQARGLAGLWHKLRDYKGIQESNP